MSVEDLEGKLLVRLVASLDSFKFLFVWSLVYRGRNIHLFSLDRIRAKSSEFFGTTQVLFPSFLFIINLIVIGIRFADARSMLLSLPS